MLIEKKTITAIALLFILSSTAGAQIVYEQPGSSTLRFNYSNWSLKNQESIDNSLSQQTYSLSGFVPLRDNFEARYYIVTGFNSLELGETSSDLSGLGDLRIQLSHSFSDDRLLLSTGLNLPTGKKELNSDEERMVIEFLSQDFLSFPLRRYGEGFGFNLQAGAATQIGSMKCGASAVYDYTGSYKPYEGSGDYNPGNSLSLSATARIDAGKIIYAGDLGFSLYGRDDLDGTEIYKQAPLFSVRMSGTIPRGRFSYTLGARMIMRGRNTRYSLTDGIIDSQLKKYGDEFDLFFRTGWDSGRKWKVGGIVASRFISASEEELEKSTVFNFGINLTRDISERLGFDLGMIYYAGSTDLNEADIRGLQISSGLSVSY